MIVNRRPVAFTKNLHHAIAEATRERIPHGQFPGVVLYIDIDPALIDVNVHPAKREIRFSHEQELHGLVYRMFKEALSASITSTAAYYEQTQPIPSPLTGNSSLSRTYSMHEPTHDYKKALAPRVLGDPGQQLFTAVLSALGQKGNDEPIKIAGQMFLTYIMAYTGDELLVIDQHAAAERVRYERYRAAWKKKSIPQQALLLPQVIELPASQYRALSEYLDAFKESGWDIELFGTNTARIGAVPAVLGSECIVTRVVQATLDALIDECSASDEHVPEHIIRASCRQSIKAHEAMSMREMEQLLRDLMACETPLSCPHGRPTIVRMHKNELDRKFKR